MREVLVAGALMLGVLPAAASAATVEAVPDPANPGYAIVARYEAARGERNDVLIKRLELGSFRVSDAGAEVEAGPGCHSLDDHTAECELAPRDQIARVTVRLGNGDDELRAENLVLDADGGHGDDRLVHTGYAAGTLNGGGGGRDHLIGFALSDGDASGSADADVLEGGSVSYRGRTRPVRVNLGDSRPDGERGEGDRLISVVSVTGGSAADRLTGSDAESEGLDGRGGPDVIRGGPGKSFIRGRGGRDRLYGGSGSDSIDAGRGGDLVEGGLGADFLRGQGGWDRIGCGGDDDTVAPRPDDLLRADCETAYAQSEESMRVGPIPDADGARRVVFSIECVEPGAFDEDSPLPIDGRAELRTRGGRLLGRGRLEEPDGYPCDFYDPPPPLPVEVDLTRRGRALAARPRGVLATIELRGSGFPDTGWTFRLRAAR
jgi:hypothetical protein